MQNIQKYKTYKHVEHAEHTKQPKMFLLTIDSLGFVNSRSMPLATKSYFGWMKAGSQKEVPFSSLSLLSPLANHSARLALTICEIQSSSNNIVVLLLHCVVVAVVVVVVDVVDKTDEVLLKVCSKLNSRYGRGFKSSLLNFGDVESKRWNDELTTTFVSVTVVVVVVVVVLFVVLIWEEFQYS